MYYCIIKVAFVLFIAINIINCEQEESRSLKPLSRNQLLLAKLDRLAKINKIHAASKSSVAPEPESTDDFNYLFDGSSLFDRLNANQKIKFNSISDHLSLPNDDTTDESSNENPEAEAEMVDFKVSRFNPYDLYYKKALSVHQPHSMHLSSLKRSFAGYLTSGEAADRLIKGKRVNRNMFSSGLQGVWGVPGR